MINIAQSRPTFRKMRGQDIKRVAELERVCFTSPWSEASLWGELKNDVAFYTVAELDGTVIGYGGMWVVFDEAHITNVAIDPNYRRQGLGRLLMGSVRDTAMGRGATRMTLEVRRNNTAAKTLYAGCGFLTVGVRRGYYSDTGEDALILWNDDLAAWKKRDEGGNS